MGGDAGDTATLISLELVPLEQATMPRLRAQISNNKNRRFIDKILVVKDQRAASSGNSINHKHVIRYLRHIGNNS
jgi:hypothetical protein